MPNEEKINRIRLPVLLACFLPFQGHAFSWEDLWKRADQRAAERFQQEQYDTIPSNAPAGWQGAANYRLGEYEQAVNSYQEEAGADAQYNQGNALVRMGSLQEALKAYDQALSIDPNMEDAKFNKALIEDLLKQQQNSQDQQRQNNQQQNNRNNTERQNQSLQHDDSGESQGSEQRPDQSEQQSESQQQDREENQNAAQQAQQSEDEDSAQTAKLERQEAPQKNKPISEQQQLLEQWLNKIPDDPGGLLRKKFAYQYSQRPQQSEKQSW